MAGVLVALMGFQGHAADQPALRLGHFPNLTHAQALFGKAENRLATQAGLNIRWSSFNAGPTAVEAIFTDAIDATFIGPSPAINGYIRSRGKKFVIVAGGAIGGAGMVVREGSDIKTEKDFGRKVIATPQLGNTQDVAARMWFMERNYRLKEKGGNLALIPLSNPDQLTMFKKGEIDGAWTVEPWLSRLELEGGGKLFLDEKELWPDGRYTTTLLIMNTSFLERNPQIAKRLLQALFAITQEINADKAGAAKILNAQLKKETGKSLADTVITRAMERVQFTMDPVPASLHKSAEAAYTLKFLRNPPALDGIVRLQLLNEVLKEQNLPEIKE